MSHATQSALARAVFCLVLVLTGVHAFAGGFGPAQGRAPRTTDGTTPVAGPASAVDSYVSVFSGTTGKLLDDRPVTVASTGQVSWPTGLGSITHISGPTDTILAIGPASGRNMRLGVSTGRWDMTSSAFQPLSDATVDLGGSSNRVKDGYFSGAVYVAGFKVPLVLTKSVTSAQTGANTDETTLWSYSLPAGTLASDAQAIRITAFGSVAANGNSKTIRIKFGATHTSSQVTTGGGVGWVSRTTVYRTGATTQVTVGEGQAATVADNVDVGTAAETLANAITIAVTGQNGTANAGDIVFRGAIVEFLP